MRHLTYLTVALKVAVPASLGAQQPERYTLGGNDIAICNLAGQLQVEAGQGDVAVQITRGGAEAAPSGWPRGRSTAAKASG